MHEADVKKVTGEINEEQAEHDLSKYQDSLASSGGEAEQPLTARNTSGATKDSTSLSKFPANLETTTPGKGPTKTGHKAMKNNQTKKTSHTMADGILEALANVEHQMRRFQVYIKKQKDEDKPMYQ